MMRIDASGNIIGYAWEPGTGAHTILWVRK